MNPLPIRHFQKNETVSQAIEEIKARHLGGYEGLLERMVQQLRDYFEGQFDRTDRKGGRSRFNEIEDPSIRPRFLIALSGGIDSAVVTYLAVKAVGIEHVLPVTMPARSNDLICLSHSALVRQALGFDESDGFPYVIDIEPIIQSHIEMMDRLPVAQIQLGKSHALQNKEQLMRSGNFASRVRIAVLYDFERSIRGRVLGTCNRTEFCQGYVAKYGTPISYDFGVLDGLYKTDVYELGRLLGIPQAIMEAAPTTGYFEGQTHEGELGATIEEQDAFAYWLFEKKYSVETLVDDFGADPEFARIMEYRYRVSSHKRCLTEKLDKIKP
jgi:NAD+ synthase